ncbi:MAG: hypothetical protein IT270_15565 [Saprospiraceae bacterium]|nr:hypothetical protein [Saprospiraceae bacterium]
MSYISTAELQTPQGVKTAVYTTMHSNSEQATIHGDVVFGSPKDDCRGAGICKIISGAEFPDLKRSCSRTQAQFQSVSDGNLLKVFFEKSSLCANLMRHYFRESSLEVKTACPVSPILASLLGLKNKTIATGIYAITTEGSGFAVTFVLV